MLNVLIACEESQEVCKAFRTLGHNAFSCDLQECSGGHPEWHIITDATNVINPKPNDCCAEECIGITFKTSNGVTHCIEGSWDLIIAHPPCTYLTSAGAVQMFRNEKKQYGSYGTFQMVNVDRMKLGILARDLFMKFLNANCSHIAIENPVPMTVYQLPKASQVIQPYEFGEPFSKRTCLWLKGLPPLMPTDVLADYQPFINGGGGRLERSNYKGKKFAEGSVARSKTFKGIANAMADQWSSYLKDNV